MLWPWEVCLGRIDFLNALIMPFHLVVLHYEVWGNYVSVWSKFWYDLDSRREPEEPEDATKGRDVFNEKPPPDELLAASDIGKAVTTSLPDNVVSFLSLFSFKLD